MFAFFICLNIDGEIMNVYIDLTVLSLFFNSIVSLYFVKVLSLKRIRVIYFLILAILNSGQIIFLYQNFYLSLILFLLINLLLFLKIFKKNFVFYFLLYFSFSYASQFLIFFTLHGLTFYKGIFLISQKEQCFALLSYPLIIIIIFLIALFVDKLYRFRNFKEKVILIIGDKKFILDGYMDSGNMLMHNNVPVVFINQNFPVEKITFTEEITVNTINGKSLLKGQKALLSFDGNKTFHYIYLCLSQQTKLFNGCECLLNINLI